MAAGDDSTADISVGDARKLSQGLRDIALLRGRTSGDRSTLGSLADGGPTLPPRAWVHPVSATAISGSPNRWKYRVRVYSNPEAVLVGTSLAIGEEVDAYNLLEVGNTATSVWGQPIEPGGDCGAITAVRPITDDYDKYPFEATLEWVVPPGGSGDLVPAYYFSAQNMLTVAE